MISNWQIKKLGEICNISSSKRIYQHEYVEAGIPFYRGKEIILKANNKEINDILYITNDKYNQIKEKFGVPKPGDILLTSVGTLGIPYMVREGELFYFKDGNITWFKDYNDEINKYFLYYWLTSHKMKDQIGASLIGVAQPALTIVSLKSFKIQVPPIKIQRKIAAILSTYDDLIENNTRRIQILEEMAQRIYREWFVHFRFPGHENVKMVDSELGMIPEGWEVRKTEEVMTVLGGGTPSTKNMEYWSNGNINWYVPKDLTKTNSTFMIESEQKINQLGLKKSSAKIFPPFSVMLTSRATIGVISINLTESCTNQGFITCIPSKQLSTYQIFYWMKENVEMFKTLASGATFKELTKSTFRHFNILVPKRIISEKFNNFIEPIMNLILNLQKKNINLHQTRDLLLPKLISGKIDVSDLDIDIGNLGE